MRPQHSRVDLDDDARADLAWWIKYALSDAYAGVSLIVDLDPITLRSLAVYFYTDSSGVCCAGGWGNRWFCHAFGVEQMPWHISVKELFSAVAVCLTFGAELRGRIVVIDSTRGNWRGRLPCWLAEKIDASLWAICIVIRAYIYCYYTYVWVVVVRWCSVGKVVVGGFWGYTCRVPVWLY